MHDDLVRAWIDLHRDTDEHGCVAISPVVKSGVIVTR